MSQKFSLYEDLTVSENIKILQVGFMDCLTPSYQIKRRKRTNSSTGFAGKEENQLVSSLPLGWETKTGSVAVIHDPKIVFLDEPTGGVDPVTRRQFWDLIYDAAHRGITVFVTTTLHGWSWILQPDFHYGRWRDRSTGHSRQPEKELFFKIDGWSISSTGKKCKTKRIKSGIHLQHHETTPFHLLKRILPCFRDRKHCSWFWITHSTDHSFGFTSPMK